MRTDSFHTSLETVLGQAMLAAGYTLERSPLQWNDGFFRYSQRDGQAALSVTFQLLAHDEVPSRFQVVLMRVLHGSVDSVKISLPHLLWDVFRVHVLSERDYWWTFSNTAELGECLLESGNLLVGFGLPWLAGALRPDADQS